MRSHFGAGRRRVPIVPHVRYATKRRHVSFAPVCTKRRGATCDARNTAAPAPSWTVHCRMFPSCRASVATRDGAMRSHCGGLHCALPGTGRHEWRPYVYPTFIPRHQPARPAFHRRHAQTAAHKPPTRRGATCDARPTAGRQRNRPHACVCHPGDMNVAPTFTPRLSHHARPRQTAAHTPHKPPTRRGATCDARPTAGRQHNRPHACVRHPGDMNVALRLPHVYPITRSRHFTAVTRAT